MAAFAGDPTVAVAQATEEYETVITDALTEFDAGRWVEALALFTRANEIYPNARVLRGIGMASFEVRDYATAVLALRAALASGERPLTEAQRAAVQELLERSLRFVAELRLTVVPSPESVLVDGRPAVVVDDVILLNPGTHQVIISAVGYQPERRTVDVVGGSEATLVVTMNPDVGEQEVEAPTTPEAPEPLETPRNGMWPVGWATLGAGAGAGVAALLTGVFAQGIHDDLTAECGGPCPDDSHQSDIDRGSRLARTSTALTFVSVAALGAGVTLIILGREGSDEPAAQLSADVGLGRAAATLRVRF